MGLDSLELQKEMLVEWIKLETDSWLTHWNSSYWLLAEGLDLWYQGVSWQFSQIQSAIYPIKCIYSKSHPAKLRQWPAQQNWFFFNGNPLTYFMVDLDWASDDRFWVLNWYWHHCYSPCLLSCNNSWEFQNLKGLSHFRSQESGPHTLTRRYSNYH